MSFPMIQWALNQKTRSNTAKAVLVYLAHRTPDDSTPAFPSLTTIALDMEMSRRTVIRAIKKLTDLDLIECEVRGAYSSYYRLKIRRETVAEQTAKYGPH